MSSRQEQNLDELLKNLRAVAQTEDDAPSPVEKKRSPKPMSDEDLQNRLKSLYQGDRAEEQNGDEDRYTLDEDFLKEAADYAAAQPMSVYERAETEVQPIEADVAVLSESEPLVIGAEDDETIEETDELEKIEESEEIDSPDLTAKIEELEVSEEPEEDEPLELLDDPQEETEESLASQSEDESFSDEAPFSEEEQKAAVLLSETLSEEDEPVWEQEEQRNASISVQTQAEAPEERVAGGRTLVQLFAEDAEVSSSDISVDDVDVVLSLSQSELDGSETEEEAEPEESQWFAEHVTEGTDDDVPWDDTVSETEITNAVRERTEEKSVSPGGIDFEPLAEEELVELPDEESAERLSEAMDDDTLNLLLQLDCKDELTASMGEERLQKRIAEQYEEDIPLDMRSIQAEEASDIKTSEVRLEQIRGAYRRRRSGLSWRLAGTVLLTLFLGLLEIPPLFGVEYGGILDYGEYPVVYVLFGLQLFLLCLAVSWKQLWESLKKTFFWKPNRYSHTVLSAIVVLVYDLFLIVTSKMLLEKPTVFHFAVSCILLVAVLSEWMLNEREYRSFKLFFSGRKKYTLTSVRGQGSLAEQMAAAEGGEAPSVFVPTGVSSPKGFFRMIAEKDTYKLYYSGFVALGLSAVLCCLCIYFGADIHTAFCAAVASFLCMLPAGFGLAYCTVLFWSSIRLEKRDCALGGSESIASYAGCRVLLLRDLHLFAKCDPRRAGIVFLCEEQKAEVLTCLHALYSAIGGPMEGVFEELPNHLHADHIRIHRIAKNGVEALVDERHVLLVGDASFLARYGLQFEEHPSASKGSVTLYISVDGLQSARISVRYTVLPTFEMLAHRLAKEGIRCVVETYDPMINSAMVARLREPTAPPVSVFHKNASDFNRSGGVVHPSEPVTIVAGASRLKLAESVVWCCRIHRLLSVFSGVSVACIVLAILTFATLTTLFGADVVFPLSVGSVNQLYAILVLVLTLVSDLLIAKLLLPQKRYFVTEEYERERERKREQEQQQRERQTARLAKKEKKTAPDPKNQEESKTS